MAIELSQLNTAKLHFENKRTLENMYMMSLSLKYFESLGMVLNNNKQLQIFQDIGTKISSLIQTILQYIFTLPILS